MTSRSQTLVHNWRLKVFAIGLSIFLWALVQTEPTNQETFEAVPVRIQVLDTAWTTSGASAPATVELRLGGPAREIISLAREGTSIRVPIGTIGARDTLITLRREWVQLGQRSGLTVESISPATVRVTFEEAQVRMIPVAMRLAGRVPDHLAMAADIELSPQLVRVRGPQSRLEGLDSLILEPFDLSSISQSGLFAVAVDTSGFLGSLVVPPTASLGIRVEGLIERVLDGITVQAVANPVEAAVVADPATIQVRVMGARSIVTALDPSRLRVWVPTDLLLGMMPGEERFVRVQIDGVPALVTAAPEPEGITVRRVIDQDWGSPEGEGPDGGSDDGRSER